MKRKRESDFEDIENRTLEKIGRHRERTGNAEVKKLKRRGRERA